MSNPSKFGNSAAALIFILSAAVHAGAAEPKRDHAAEMCHFLIASQGEAYPQLRKAIGELRSAGDDVEKIRVALSRVRGFHALPERIARVLEAIYWLDATASAKGALDAVRFEYAQGLAATLYGLSVAPAAGGTGGGGGGAPPSTIAGAPNDDRPSHPFQSPMTPAVALRLRHLEVNLLRSWIKPLEEALDEMNEESRKTMRSKELDRLGSLPLFDSGTVCERLVHWIEAVRGTTLTEAQKHQVCDGWKKGKSSATILDEIPPGEGKHAEQPQAKPIRAPSIQMAASESRAPPVKVDVETSNKPRTSVPTTKPKFVKFEMMYQAARRGNIEPCDCSFSPYGGLDREATAVSHEGHGGLYVDAGEAFVPNQEKIDVEFQRGRAKAVLEMMNLARVDVFSPGTTDLRLGVDFLRELKSAADFPFVCTNLVDENDLPVFTPFHMPTRGGRKVAFLGVVAEGRYGEHRALAPETAIRAYLDEALKVADFVIVLAPLNSLEQVEALSKAIPEVAIWISSEDNKVLDWGRPVGRSLILDPLSYGFYVYRFSAAMQLPHRGFYSVDLLSSYRDDAENGERYLEMRQRHIKNTDSEEHRRIIKLGIESFRQRYAQSKQHLIDYPAERATIFEHESIALDSARFKHYKIAEMLIAERERTKNYRIDRNREKVEK